MSFRYVDVGNCEKGNIRHKFSSFKDEEGFFYCMKCGLQYGVVEKK